MSQYTDAVKRMADAAPQDGSRLPCHLCGEPTLHATLTQYGARCYPCYERWCAEPQTGPNVGDRRATGPLAWAHALKTREEAGERLTLSQKVMWREALGRPITGAIPTWEQTDEEYRNGSPALRAHV